MLFLTPDINRKLETVLQAAVQRSEAKCIYICDRGGNIVAQYTRTNIPLEDNLSALAAGSFFATQELARLLGEGGFQCVFHQGANASIYMQDLSGDMLMLVVFGKESNPGLIRLYCGQASRIVNKLIAAAEGAAAQAGAGMGLKFEIDETAQPFSRATS